MIMGNDFGIVRKSANSCFGTKSIDYTYFMSQGLRPGISNRLSFGGGILALSTFTNCPGESIQKPYRFIPTDACVSHRLATRQFG